MLTAKLANILIRRKKRSPRSVHFIQKAHFFAAITFGFSIRNVFKYQTTTQDSDSLPCPFSMLFINYFSNILTRDTQCHMFGLFLVPHFAPSFSFGCDPSPLAQLYFVAWQEGPFEVIGASVRRGGEQGLWRDTPQALEAQGVTAFRL